MAIKDWHGGQLVVLWVGAFLAAVIAVMVIYFAVPEDDPPWMIVGIVLAAILATPGVLLVITWKWFAGKRQRD